MSNAILQFDTIPLHETAKVRLMNRIDTKYVVPATKLKALLEEARPYYLVQLNMVGERQAHYRTIYLDTAEHDMYHRHTLQRLVRCKVRLREYADTGEVFLEVKRKNNHGKTAKQRVQIDATLEDAVKEYSRYTTDHHGQHIELPLQEPLTPHLMNEFYRITLVARDMSERITIDTGLSFHNMQTGEEASLAPLAIIEVKRDGCVYSHFHALLVRVGIHSMGFSKYCVGSALTNSMLRRNNMKEKLHKIQKLCKNF